MHRRHLLQFGALLAASCGAARHAWAALQGATQDDLWRDARREREVPVRVRWPGGEGACALIAYSHGLGGSRDGGDVWGRAWQQAGFAVLHLQHAGSDTAVLRGGLRAAASAEQLLARVADMQFAVDEITRRAQAGEPGWSRVRRDALGAAGHSFGALTVQALAGQRFGSAAAGLVEPRFKAFVALSPSPGQGRAAGEAFAAVTRPFLAVTGSLDGDALGRGLGGADRAGVYDALPGGQRALLWLDGADHLSFAGNAAPPLRARAGPLQREGRAAELEPQHHQRIATVTTLWWRATLLGDAAAAADLRAPADAALGERWRRD